MQEGTVKFFNESRGFGIIVRPGSEDVFVHYKDIIPKERGGFRVLHQNEKVSFDIEMTPKGPKAINVKTIM